MKKKKPEVQSRREFFKKTAKSVLPIMGILISTHVPIIAKGNTHMAMGCETTCWGACTVTCFGCSGKCTGCTGSCTGVCTGCENMCKETCRLGCQRECQGGCKNECTGNTWL